MKGSVTVRCCGVATLNGVHNYFLISLVDLSKQNNQFFP